MNQDIAVRRVVGIAVLATGLLIGAGSITASAADPAPAAIQQPRPEAANGRGTIQIPAGSTSATVNGAVPRGDWDHWGVRAQAGQSIAVRVSSTLGNATFEVYSPSGAQLANDVLSFSGTAGSTGLYAIDVGSTGGLTNYALTVSVTGTPTPAPAPTPPAPAPGPGTRPGHNQGNIDVADGTGTASGTVGSGNWHHWGFRATAGQTMSVTVSGGATFELYSPSGGQVANDVVSFAGTASATGLWAIDVGPTGATANYTINITLGPAPAAPPAPAPAPAPGPGTRPGHNQGNIDVADGTGTASGTVGSGNWHHWGFRATAGQTMSVTVSGGATFELYSPSGGQVANDVVSFTGTASATGLWAIDVGPTGATANYTINITLGPAPAAPAAPAPAPPAPAPPAPAPPAPAPGPGNLPGHRQGTLDVADGSATATGFVQRGNWHEWPFRGTVGQRVTVTTSGGATFSLYEPNGNVMAAHTTSFSGVLPATGFYMIEVGAADGSANYTLNVTAA